MNTTQNDRQLKIATPLGEDFLLLQKITFSEGLSRLFEGELELWRDEGEAGREPTFVDPEKILGKPVTVCLEQRDGVRRYFCGIVNEFEQGVRDMRFSVYHARVVPHVWMLTQTRQSRIFQNLSVPDILRRILGGFECTFEFQHAYEPRNYCVQYQETDFDFISRLMEEEGIYYYFEHTDKTHRMILADTPQSHRVAPEKPALEYHDGKFVGAEGVATGVRQWRWRNKWRTGRVRLWDYNFQLPANKLNAEQPSLFLNGNRELEVYEFPAGYARKLDGIAAGGGEQSDKLQKIFEDREHTAKVRMQEIDSQNRTATAATDCANLTAGYRFELRRHPVAANNTNYVITGMLHEAVQSPAYITGEVPEQAYANQLDCIAYGAGQAPFRPPRRTPKPHVRGSQTATVVGPAGEEIFTDKFGRVKVQFHWDREGRYDESSSCWIRVGQLWAGKRWGAMFIPRIGMEVIVQFLEGDPDQPIITGCVYNPETMPPYALPDEKTKSGVKTDSTKGGGGFNELRFDDKKGSEQIFIHGERNLDVRVKNDSFEYVGRDRHLIAGGDRLEKIAKDQHLKIGGDRSEAVGGSVSLKVGADEDIRVGAKFAVDAGNEIHLKSGANLVIETGANLTLKVGGNFININAGGIFIKGTMVMINSGGAAGAGAGANPDAPKEAKEADRAEAGGRVAPPKPLPPVKPLAYSQAAMVLKKAHKEGTPFCEVCSRKK
ncbi:MAG: type VI secretion system tip protein VgrG [Acidobacteria bacterium]|nr:type VI secretion system tip protein VgrG [Acidobacteriota bacterium]